MESLDYEKFKFFKDNRRVNKKLVERIKNSIEDIGYITAKPILVNSKFEIIDGQHRFLACEDLNVPVYYEISDIDHQKAMVVLNANQQNWRLADYVNLHAQKRIKCYVRLLQFEEKYKMGISNSIVIVFQGAKGGVRVREGFEFELNKDREEIVEFLYESKNYLSFWKTAKFVTSIVELFRRCDKKDLEKITSKIMIIRQQANISNYLLMYENIINKGKTKKISLIIR